MNCNEAIVVEGWGLCEQQFSWKTWQRGPHGKIKWEKKLGKFDFRNILREDVDWIVFED
jgi:hypothetical protein